MRAGIEALRRELGNLPREVVVTLLATLVVTIIVPWILAVTLDDQVPVWVVVLVGGICLSAGIVRGASEQGSSTADIYAIHVRDALADLRKVLSSELPNFSLREFIETGIFEPAHVLLQRDRAGHLRGDVRLSILHPTPDGRSFAMADKEGLFPAHGHRAESRERFRMSIAGSFSGVAFHTGNVQVSNDLRGDDRYNPHPLADSRREYESIVSVPLWKAGRIDGVLNVIATRKNAFSASDRTYVTLLASVIDVARTIASLGPEDASQSQDGDQHEGDAHDAE